MGRLKESIPDYIWDIPEEETNKFWLEKDIEAIVSNGTSDNEELKAFLNTVTPTTGPDYFIYVKDESTGTYTNIKHKTYPYTRVQEPLPDNNILFSLFKIPFFKELERIPLTSSPHHEKYTKLHTCY